MLLFSKYLLKYLIVKLDFPLNFAYVHKMRRENFNIFRMISTENK